MERLVLGTLETVRNQQRDCSKLPFAPGVLDGGFAPPIPTIRVQLDPSRNQSSVQVDAEQLRQRLERPYRVESGRHSSSSSTGNGSRAALRRHPNVFISPQIWFAISSVASISLVRAAARVCKSMQSKPFTRTSLKKLTPAG